MLLTFRLTVVFDVLFMFGIRFGIVGDVVVTAQEIEVITLGRIRDGLERG